MTEPTQYGGNDGLAGHLIRTWADMNRESQRLLLVVLLRTALGADVSPDVRGTANQTLDALTSWRHETPLPVSTVSPRTPADAAVVDLVSAAQIHLRPSLSSTGNPTVSTLHLVIQALPALDVVSPAYTAAEVLRLAGAKA